MPEPSISRPLMIYDGDCSFCRRWITRWKHRTGEAIEYQPYQVAAERVPQVPRENFGQAVHLVEPDGRITRGAEAVFRSLSHAGQSRSLRWLYDNVPPVAWASETIYGLIARHRNSIDMIDRIVVGTETLPPTYTLTRAVFLRLLGVIYLIAFWSFYVQIDGLVGSKGILPATALVDAATMQLHASRWWTLPTLAYISSSDAFLHGLCIAGIACSCLLIVGVVPLLMTIALYVTYLSLLTCGQIFLGYQWDILLLETGFLAILWSPLVFAGLHHRHRPSRVMLFMIRWLLFRLMFLSALVKWYSGDDCWRNLTALRYHFETQPIPTWTSWYAHHSPTWLLSTSCAIMFFIEAIVPFFYFLPRRTRMLGFWLTVLLQVNIMLTGNYGFFNLLTIVLAVTLLDDAAIKRMLRTKLPQLSFSRPRLRPFLLVPVMLAVFVVGIMEGVDRVSYRSVAWPAPLEALDRAVRPFCVANSYGLFAAMTKTRPEVIVEGSNDQRDWQPYEFKWKAGDLARRPGFCEPHMPRLDWQMWFLPLDPRNNQNWFVGFAVKLLQGEPAVLGLMGRNPFADHPPKYVRAVMYDYQFSSVEERKSTGAWWTRKPVGILLPPVSLQQAKPIEQDESFHL